MKLQKMTLENFRAFKSAEISFEPDVTVLVGVNGSGKSSVLQGLVLELQRIVFGIMFDTLPIPENTSESSLFPKKSDYSDIEKKLKIYLTINKINKEKPFGEEFCFSRKEAKDIYIDDRYLPELIINELSNLFQKKKSPIIIFYSADRAVDTNINLDALTADYNLSDPFLAYTDAFDAKTDFTEFLTWFKAREDLDNQNFRLEGKEKYKEDAHLEAVRKALPYFLEGFTKPHVNRQGKTALYLLKGKETFSLNQLSDGEKNIFAMVSDIARRLAIANPEMENPLLGDGLVLIDEIDLHLHPNWQRKVIPSLKKAFPNVQFIVTTHSPQVLGEVDARCIRILEPVDGNIEIHKSSEGKGFSSDEILELVMDSTSKNQDAVAEYDALFDLIYKKDIEKAKAKLAELKDLYGETESVIEAETMLSFLE